MSNGILPPEVIQYHLVHYLDLQDTASLRSTCKRWSAACLPHLLSELDSRTTSFEKFLIAFPQQSGCLSLVQSLSILFRSDEHDFETTKRLMEVFSLVGPSIRYLKLEGHWEPASVAEILMGCKKLRQLCLWDCSFHNSENGLAMGIAISSLGRLEELVLSVVKGGGSLMNAIFNNTLAGSLSKLELYACEEDEPIFAFISRQHNLKSLKLSISEYGSGFDIRFLEMALANLSLLEELEIKIWSFCPFPFSLLKYCPRIRIFKFDGQILSNDWDVFMTFWYAKKWPSLRSFEIAQTRFCNRQVAHDILTVLGSSLQLLSFGFSCTEYLSSSFKHPSHLESPESSFVPSKSLRSLSYHPPRLPPPSKLFELVKEHSTVFPNLNQCWSQLTTLHVSSLTIDGLSNILPSFATLKQLEIHFQEDMFLERFITAFEEITAVANHVEVIALSGDIVEEAFSPILRILFKMRQVKRITLSTGDSFNYRKGYNTILSLLLLVSSSIQSLTWITDNRNIDCRGFTDMLLFLERMERIRVEKGLRITVYMEGFPLHLAGLPFDRIWKLRRNIDRRELLKYCDVQTRTIAHS
ncbi:hypothetical protein HDU67_002851 [Dinochytrium kinnereticum]|nr:hypothetical protein HDU67_002851 [Dinochytrium kinnereticum]